MNRLLKIILAAAGGLAVGRRLGRPSGKPAQEAAAPGQAEGAERRRGFIKQWALRAAVIAAVFGVGGFLLAASGIIPIKASSGHWPITAWFLNFSSERSVSTHSVGIKVPELNNPSLILKGAGHFDIGCRPCHGSPDLPHPRIAAQMVPHPPYLPEVLPQWEAAELFYIVKHGLKFTGMPAWPAQQREDEVWSIVAFLQRLPHLDAAGYREAVGRGTAELTEPVAPAEGPNFLGQSCDRCHGADGLGRGRGAFPRLAGQRPDYLYLSLQAYKHGERHSGIMQPMAAALSLEQMRTLALHFASLPSSGWDPAETLDPESIARGREIAHQGVPLRGIPSCADCHGPARTKKNRFYPKLAGQYASYIQLQLDLFQKGNRGGTPYSHLMRRTAERLTQQQMKDVASYYASLRE